MKQPHNSLQKAAFNVAVDHFVDNNSGLNSWEVFKLIEDDRLEEQEDVAVAQPYEWWENEEIANGINSLYLLTTHYMKGLIKQVR